MVLVAVDFARDTRLFDLCYARLFLGVQFFEPSHVAVAHPQLDEADEKYHRYAHRKDLFRQISNITCS